MQNIEVEKIKFANSHIALVREDQVKNYLSLDNAITDLRAALSDLGRGEAMNCARVRAYFPKRRSAWLHTLRAGLANFGIAGGKDYTSLGFETPAMWATIVDTHSGLPVALIEAVHLSLIRTAAITAIATDLLAPADAQCVAHFGAGKISEQLVRAVLRVRPSVRQVLLVRRDPKKGPPHWLLALKDEVTVEMTDAFRALSEADIVTTATSSVAPVIPSYSNFARLKHLNLIGSNHLGRKEIPDDLALRCLAPDAYLVVDDREQAALEAGDFSNLSAPAAIIWEKVPTLAQLIVEPAERSRAAQASFTVFKSVGIGLADLAVASGVLRRMGVIPGVPVTQGEPDHT